MIRKFLICGKQVFLSSKRLDDPASKTPVLELLLPITLFWDVEKLLQRIDYLSAAGEDQVLVHEHVRKIYKKVVKYAVLEKDRIFLQDKVRG